MSTLATLPEGTEDLYVQVGARVHQLMWQKKITQTAMAPRMGIAQSVLGRKLRGVVTWTVRDLVRAASILEVDVNDLLPASDAGPQPTDAAAACPRQDSNLQPTDHSSEVIYLDARRERLGDVDDIAGWLAPVTALPAAVAR